MRERASLMREQAIRELREPDLGLYAELSIAFEVCSRYEVIGTTLEELQLIERAVEPPWTKNYDQIPEQHPLSWTNRWPLHDWIILGAYHEKTLCGGCAVAIETAGVDLLEGRDDLGLLWDLRVSPEYRRRGIGTLLFEAAVSSASAKGCRELKIETQNINVPACRF